MWCPICTRCTTQEPDREDMHREQRLLYHRPLVATLAHIAGPWRFLFRVRIALESREDRSVVTVRHGGGKRWNGEVSPAIVINFARRACHFISFHFSSTLPRTYSDPRNLHSRRPKVCPSCLSIATERKDSISLPTRRRSTLSSLEPRVRNHFHSMMRHNPRCST